MVPTNEALRGKKGVLIVFSADGLRKRLQKSSKFLENFVLGCHKDIEIVLVSSDKTDGADEDEVETKSAKFAEMFKDGNMPWLALPYERRDFRTALQKQYQVEGADKRDFFVMVDGVSGSLIRKSCDRTRDCGQIILHEDPEDVTDALLVKPLRHGDEIDVAELLGTEFQFKDGLKSIFGNGKPEENYLAGKKMLAIFFSAKPTGFSYPQEFTAQLAKVYEFALL